MQAIHRAARGALFLCAAALLAACSTNGTQRQPVAVETQIVEVPRRQLVQVSGEMTAVPTLAPAPAPAVPFGPKCDRAAGCFSNRQLEGMLALALDWGGRMADQLDSIRGLMAESLQGKPDAHDPAPVPGPDQRREDR